MRRLLPAPVVDIDPARAYADVERPRPADRPWVTILMIGSADGATVVDGKSGALGGPGDKAVYRTVRGLADAILVGGATTRAERYLPLPEPKRLLVVTGSGDIGEPELLHASTTTLVMPASAPAPDGARVLRAGTDRVDLGAALRSLDDRQHVVCEGGPSLNGQMLAEGLVDEVCLSLAPRFAAGESQRMAHGKATASLDAWTLAHVLHDDDGFLFLRYLRAR